MAVKKRILLVDDHPLLREGISRLINQQPDLIICAEAADRASALEAAEQTRPDLAVVDLSLKDERGLELIKDFKARFPTLLILVLSMHEESLYAERVLRAGACGYIMKREASTRVLEALRCVLAGGVFASGKITSAILEKITGRAPALPHSPVLTLSDRELEVLLWIGKGYGSRQIAERLCISLKTVEAHRARIRVKLNLPSSGELLQYAIRWASQTGQM